MSSSFSPTGYWAHYVHTDEYIEMGGERVTSLPVISTSDGVAQVIDWHGKVVSVDRVFPSGLVDLLTVLPRPTFTE
jgi:hypothetical protein